MEISTHHDEKSHKLNTVNLQHKVDSKVDPAVYSAEDHKSGMVVWQWYPDTGWQEEEVKNKKRSKG